MESKLVQFLLDHNASQSAHFSSPDQFLTRRNYRAAHNTEIAALKCMDGRLNLPVMTKTPYGIIQPFRTIGGKFDLGDLFGQTFNEFVRYASARARKCLVLVTYHYSKGDINRGCAGNGNDKAASIAYATKLKADIETVYGTAHSVVHPILVGIETDEDGLVLHGEDGSEMDLAGLPPDVSAADLRRLVAAHFPNIDEAMLRDFMPLLMGNVHHTAELRAAHRPIVDKEHREQIIGVGRGFDWLYLINKALIVGPYSYDLAHPIRVAGKVVLGNIAAGRIPKEEGVVLLTSAIYRDEAGPDRHRAAMKAKTLQRIALEALQEHAPELMQYVTPLAGTVNMSTRKFTPVETAVSTMHAARAAALAGSAPMDARADKRPTAARRRSTTA